MRLIILILLLSCCFNASIAQSLTISGKVTEDDGKAIYGAQVFLNGTSISLTSDKEGNFKLTGLSAGNYELIVNLLGYKTFSRPLLVDKDLTVNVELAFNVVALKEVIVKPDPHRETNLQVFKENFLGMSANAKYCRILNPEALNISFDASKNVMEADSGGDFLLIENKALGYTIKYLLLDFRLNFTTNILTYQGKTYYEDLAGSSSRKKRWNSNRIQAYYGSVQHFLTAVYNRNVYREGYTINRLIRKPNPDRPSDSVINANIRKHAKLRNGTMTIGNDDSSTFWINKRKLPKVMQYLIKGNITTDTMLRAGDGEIRQLRFNDCLYVTYTKEREPVEYSTRRNTYPRPLDEPNYQVSIITLDGRYAAIDPKGSLTDPLSLFFEGYWAFEKVADLLPTDYVPPK
ncbi:MAG TPA: carboxypeptidase-like regulatory domain-containing protein [Sphingobacteriaceae bacterium]